MTLAQTEPKKIYIWVESSSRLPAEYQEVEYVQNSGTQHINTQLKVCNGYRFVSKLMSTATGTGSGNMITGGYLGYSGGIYYRLYFGGIGGIQGNGWTYGYLNQYLNGGLSTASQNTDYEVDVSWISGNAYIKIDGTSIYTSSNTYNISTDHPCLLFACNSDGVAEVSRGTRIYYAQYYDSSNNKVMDLIPCYRKADSVIGMYDLVNDTFYTNAGSGTFTKGPDVN